MKLKDLFRRKDVVNLKDSTNLKEKELIRKISRVGHLRLKLTAKSKFKLLDNLTFLPPTTTFELVDYPGHVLRARGLELIGEKKRDDQGFAESSAFVKMPDLWFDGFVSFESSQIAGHYIRLRGNELILGRYDGSKIFKEECSFKMTRNGSSCDGCSFKNEWVEDATGIGYVVADGEELGHQKSKESKLLMVPESPPNLRRLPGLIAVEGHTKKQTVFRKDSEEFRRKKLVTFNKRNIIHEHEPFAWQRRLGNRPYECSPLNSVREITESEAGSSDESSSSMRHEIERNFKVIGNNERHEQPQFEKGKRKIAETRYFDFSDDLSQYEDFAIRDSVMKDRDLGHLQHEQNHQEECSRSEENSKIDNDSELSLSFSSTSAKETCYSYERKCSCQHNSLGSDANFEERNKTYSIGDVEYDWLFKNNCQKTKKENVIVDQTCEITEHALGPCENGISRSSMIERINDGEVSWKSECLRTGENLIIDHGYRLPRDIEPSDESDPPNSTYEAGAQIENVVESSRSAKQVIEVKGSSKPKIDHEITNKRLGDLLIEDNNDPQTIPCYSSDSSLDRSLHEEPRFQDAVKERRENNGLWNEVIVTFDNKDPSEKSANDIVLVCLPDVPRKQGNGCLRLPKVDLLNSERDRADSGLPLSPCGEDLIAKRMNRKVFFPSTNEQMT